MDQLDIQSLALDRIYKAFERPAVSSAIPSSEVAGTGRHSLRETAPEVLGGSTPDRGPATVGVLSGRERMELLTLRADRREHRQLVDKLMELFEAERFDAAASLVRDEFHAINGK